MIDLPLAILVRIRLVILRLIRIVDSLDGVARLRNLSILLSSTLLPLFPSFRELDRVRYHGHGEDEEASHAKDDETYEQRYDYLGSNQCKFTLDLPISRRYTFIATL